MTMSKSVLMRALIVPLGAICMFLSGSAEAAPNPRDPNKLERITSPEGGFTVVMPCGVGPTTTRTVTTAQGPVTEHTLHYSTGSEEYEVVYADFQGTPNESLQSFINLISKNKILTNIDITSNGHRGKLFTLVMEEGKYAGVTFFSVESRIIFAAYSSTDPAGLQVHGTAFLESLQLTR
jgi:hypothetical protein